MRIRTRDQLLERLALILHTRPHRGPDGEPDVTFDHERAADIVYELEHLGLVHFESRLRA